MNLGSCKLLVIAAAAAAAAACGRSHGTPASNTRTDTAPAPVVVRETSAPAAPAPAPDSNVAGTRAPLTGAERQFYRDVAKQSLAYLTTHWQSSTGLVNATPEW